MKSGNLTRPRMKFPIRTLIRGKFPFPQSYAIFVTGEFNTLEQKGYQWPRSVSTSSKQGLSPTTRRTVKAKSFCRLWLVVQGILIGKWQDYSLLRGLVWRFFHPADNEMATRPQKGVLSHLTGVKRRDWYEVADKTIPFFHTQENGISLLFEWGWSFFYLMQL